MQLRSVKNYNLNNCKYLFLGLYLYHTDKRAESSDHREALKIEVKSKSIMYFSVSCRQDFSIVFRGIIHAKYIIIVLLGNYLHKTKIRFLLSNFQIIELECHSFLRIHVLAAYFGRYVKPDNRLLCNGEQGSFSIIKITQVNSSKPAILIQDTNIELLIKPNLYLHVARIQLS